MKLSRKTLFIIAAGVLIIALAGVYTLYLQKGDELTQLNDQLTSKQSELMGIQLEQLSRQQTELEEQVSQATAQLEAAKAPFSELAGSTTAISIFLKVAEANGLEVTEIKSPGPAEDKLEELAFWGMPLTAKVKGNTPNLVSFLIELDSSLVTGVIVSVTTEDNTSTENDTSTENNTLIESNALTEIKLVFYTYRSDLP